MDIASEDLTDGVWEKIFGLESVNSDGESVSKLESEFITSDSEILS